MAMRQTPWKIYASDEKALTVYVSFAYGVLQARNEDDGTQMNIRYRSVSLGAGKGPPVGYSWSNPEDPNGSLENVSVIPGRGFGMHCFPCDGYMLGASLAALAGGNIQMDVKTSGVAVVLFGVTPVFAGARLWGQGRSTLPGIGLSAGIAKFWIA